MSAPAAYIARIEDENDETTTGMLMIGYRVYIEEPEEVQVCTDAFAKGNISPLFNRLKAALEPKLEEDEPSSTETEMDSLWVEVQAFAPEATPKTHLAILNSVLVVSSKSVRTAFKITGMKAVVDDEAVVDEPVVDEPVVDEPVVDEEAMEIEPLRRGKSTRFQPLDESELVGLSREDLRISQACAFIASMQSVADPRVLFMLGCGYNICNEQAKDVKWWTEAFAAGRDGPLNSGLRKTVGLSEKDMRMGSLWKDIKESAPEADHYTWYEQFIKYQHNTTQTNKIQPHLCVILHI